MATITLTVPDNIAARVNNKFAAYHGYSATVTNENGTTSANPQSKAQFLKAKLSEFVRNSVAGQEAKEASDAAHLAALTQADSDIVLS